MDLFLFAMGVSAKGNVMVLDVWEWSIRGVCVCDGSSASSGAGAGDAVLGIDAAGFCFSARFNLNFEGAGAGADSDDTPTISMRSSSSSSNILLSLAFSRLDRVLLRVARFGGSGFASSRAFCAVRPFAVAAASFFAFRAGSAFGTGASLAGESNAMTLLLFVFASPSASSPTSLPFLRPLAGALLCSTPVSSTTVFSVVSLTSPVLCACVLVLLLPLTNVKSPSLSSKTANLLLRRR
jgi:hypothetical protein